MLFPRKKRKEENVYVIFWNCFRYSRVVQHHKFHCTIDFSTSHRLHLFFCCFNLFSLALSLPIMSSRQNKRKTHAGQQICYYAAKLKINKNIVLFCIQTILLRSLNVGVWINFFFFFVKSLFSNASFCLQRSLNQLETVAKLK